MEKKEILNKLNELGSLTGKEFIKKVIKSHKRGKTEAFLEFLRDKKKDIKFNRFDTYRWERGIIPDTIKTLLKIHKKEFHRINKKVLARLIGYGLGDGGINKKFQAYFICGKKEDLVRIKKYIQKNIPNTNPIIKRNDGTGKITNTKNNKTRKILGKSWILYIRDATFCRFLYSLGIPNGQKVLKKFEIPLWIKKENKKIKLEFLEAILECENQKHRVKIKTNKVEITAISFGMCKEEKYREDLIIFLESIKRLLEEFGIECGNVERTKLSSIRKRDGKITYFSRFHIYSSAINVIKFSKVIKYKFNKEKRSALKVAIKEAKNKLKRFEKQKEKFKEASELFNQGMNYSQIARKLDVSHITVKDWVVKKEHLPRYLNTDLGGFFK